MHTKQIADMIEQKRDSFIKVSDRIWELAETRFEEYQSAELLAQTLEAEGFQVERGVGGIKTAFIGSFGSGSPVVAILGEFDALSGMSQKKARPKKSRKCRAQTDTAAGTTCWGRLRWRRRLP